MANLVYIPGNKKGKVTGTKGKTEAICGCTEMVENLTGMLIPWLYEHEKFGRHKIIRKIENMIYIFGKGDQICLRKDIGIKRGQKAVALKQIKKILDKIGYQRGSAIENRDVEEPMFSVIIDKCKIPVSTW